MPSKRSRAWSRRKKVEAVSAKMSAILLDALEHSISEPVSETLIEAFLLQAKGVLGAQVRVVDLPPDEEAEQRLDGTFDPNKITFEATVYRPHVEPFIEVSFLVAGELAGNAVCVKKLEAAPMDSGIKGMTGVELEQALKSDAKDRAMDCRIDPGTKPPLNLEPVAAPGSSAPQPPKKEWVTPSITSIAAPAPSKDLPAGMKMVLWIPIQQGDGTTIFQCSVEGFGYKATASSRSKVKALAYALEDMARMMVEAEG